MKYGAVLLFNIIYGLLSEFLQPSCYLYALCINVILLAIPKYVYYSVNKYTHWTENTLKGSQNLGIWDHFSTNVSYS